METNRDTLPALERLHALYPEIMNVIATSIDCFKPKQQYDAIVSCMVLHFLENQQVAKKVIADLKAWTKPGGINLLTSYLDSNTLTSDYSFLLQKNQLHKMYDDWEIVWYEERYARNLKNSKAIKDLARVLCGQKGYKAARIIARKPL